MYKKFLVVFLGFSLFLLQNLEAGQNQKGCSSKVCIDDEMPYPMICAIAAERTAGVPFVLISSPICWQEYEARRPRKTSVVLNLASSSAELDQLNSELDDFSPIVRAARVVPTVDTTFMVKHSPEGVSLYPFSPKAVVSKSEQQESRWYMKYNEYINRQNKCVQSDNDEWSEVARKRNRAFRSGKF